MADLAEQKREQYKTHAPVFHRPTEGAREIHEPFLRSLVDDAERVTLVHEADDGNVDGFLIAMLVPAPPVYDPGGPTCSVDDFMVESPERWESAGRALLERAVEITRERGAVQTVVVCGPQDQPKRAMLISLGHDVASEWFTLPFAQS
ncbi:MAG: GNAT family N-acetyltransferase [Actinobacteria bacterium]|nr:GNAT family N-acetyltransferase [Actinomycetota bacterium]